MRCKKCREKIEDYDIFCHKCGKETELLNNELSSRKNLKKIIDDFRGEYSNYMQLSFFLFLTQFLPLIAILSWLHFYPVSANQNLNFALKNLAVLVFIPFMLIPFSMMKNNQFSIKSYFENKSSYPKMLAFTFINVLFYVSLKLICVGDPILHIVWLILAIYWIAINVPTLYLITTKDMPVLQSIKLAYNAGRETRWQQFFTIFSLTAICGISFLVLGFGLIFTIPLIYLAIYNYGHQLDKLTLFENIQ